MPIQSKQRLVENRDFATVPRPNLPPTQSVAIETRPSMKVKPMTASIRFSHSFATITGLALICLMLTGCQLNFSMVDGYSFDRTGVTADKVIEGQFNQDITVIEIENKFGSINVETADGKPSWTWEAKVWADDHELADMFISELEMDDVGLGHTQTLTIKLPESSRALNGIESNLTLRIPPGVQANLINSHGNLIANQLTNELNIQNQHGDVSLREISGNLTAKNSHGNLNATQVANSIIDVRHGNIDLLMAEGDVDISSSHGRLKAEKIFGAAKITASHSDVTINELSQNGEFKLSHGDLNLTNAYGDVTSKNSHGSTSLDTTGRNVLVKATHGKINLTHRNDSFDSIKLSTTHSNIELNVPSTIQSEIEMAASHGSGKSEIASTPGATQSIKLNTSHGNIRLKALESAVSTSERR
jgi:hypothetical protein